MVKAILVISFPHVARGRPQSCQLPVVQSSVTVFACLHAWDQEENVVVGFTFDVSPIIGEI